MNPMPGAMPAKPETPAMEAAEHESPDMAQGDTITIVCKLDGTYLVNGEAIQDLEDALRKVVQICQDGHGEATKEQDFQSGFKKSTGPDMAGGEI